MITIPNVSNAYEFKSTMITSSFLLSNLGEYWYCIFIWGSLNNWIFLCKEDWRYDWKMLTYKIIMDGRGLQLLGWNSGFIVAPTHQPCTKGLWLWSPSVKCTTLNNIEYNLLFLDNEDMDTYDKAIFFNMW